MNRPLALIQGDLALPNARLLRGLPPPYGVYRWPGRSATHRRAQPAASSATQQAIQDAVRRREPQARHNPFAPGQKFRFLYKLPKPRDHSSRLDAELAEARHYLEMGKTRQRSSRSDYVLGATIFVACSIVLTWLLTTCSTHDADKAATAALTWPAVAQTAPAPTNPAPNIALRSEPKPSLQAALPAKPTLAAQHIEPFPAARALIHDTVTGRATTAKVERKMTVPHQNEAQFDDRVTLDRSIRPATRAAASTQAEWTAHSSSADDDTTEQATWPDWAARQERRPNATTRAHASAPALPVADWNAHMTQRRITDNPAAFQIPSGQN